METCSDFIQCFGTDVSLKILMYLKDSSDLVRFSAVSSYCRQFVIANGLCKQLCLRMFPGISRVAHVIEVNSMIEPVEGRLDDSMEWECLERDHRVYASLARGFTFFMRKDCIKEAISASSTDNYPEESIQNTLLPEMVEQRTSYWSSAGESDPAVPETLVYKIANFCVITEIRVQPFQAYFQFGFPIYSAKAVRFRIGHPNFPDEIESDITNESATSQKSAAGEFIWTYTSPEFPMAQENCLQKFKLPEPVLCIGGILQIELLGRVQRQEMDGLYYMCVALVQAMGRPLSPAFDVEILDPSGKCTLMCNPEAEYYLSRRRSSEREASAPSQGRTFTARLMQNGGWEQMILTFLGTGAVVGDGEESDDSDDDLFG